MWASYALSYFCKKLKTFESQYLVQEYTHFTTLCGSTIESFGPKNNLKICAIWKRGFKILD